MPAREPSEWRDALAAELHAVEARISELEWQKRTRAQLRAALDASREARRTDRLRAIAALGRPTRAVVSCGDSTDAPARPRRCPGCGVEVVDPRGLVAEEVTARLGTNLGWLARSDGLLAVRACPRPRFAVRSVALTTLVGVLGALAYVLVLALIVGR